MKLDRFILNYDGNKYLETRKHLTDFIKNNHYELIAEPYCGIFGFSRAFYELQPNNNYEIWLNDIDPDLINFLKQLMENPEEIINRINDTINKYPTDAELTKAYRKCDDVDMIKSIFRTSGYYLLSLQKGKLKIKNYLEKLNDYKIFFKNVKLFNMDADDFIKLVVEKNVKTLIYYDPPYFQSSNTSYTEYYRKYNEHGDIDNYKDGTSMYVSIYEMFKNNDNPNISLLFVMNKIDIINFLFKKYFYKNYEGKYQNHGKNKKRHVVYYK